MTIMTTTLAGGSAVKANSLVDVAKHGKELLNGTRTLKDMSNQRKEQGKNLAKGYIKQVASNAVATAGIAGCVARMAGKLKLPQFAEDAISSLKNTPIVKKAAETIAEEVPSILTGLATVAKKHPLGLAVVTAITAAWGIYNIANNTKTSREDGKIQQKYDDIVEIRKNQLESNPLVKDI